MPLIDTNHQRAALLVLLLGLGLVIALTPYATGLIGIPVLYAVFAPVHEWLSLRARPKVAASLVVVLALFLIVVPGVSFAGLIVNQAQQITGSVVRRSEEHTSELQSHSDLVCRLLLEKKKKNN